MDPETKQQLTKLENISTDSQQPQPLAVDMTLVEYGSSNDIEVIPRIYGAVGQVDHFPMRTQLLPCGLPPAEDSNLKSELEKLLLSPEDLPIFELNKLQQFWPRQSDPSSLYHVDLKPNQMTLKVTRDMMTGMQQEYEEVSIENSDLTSRNSTSLKRSPIPERDRGPVTGQSTNMPFWPGGFDPLQIQPPDIEETDELNFDTCELLTDPPNFGPGMNFDRIICSENKVEVSESSKIPISEILTTDIPWIEDDKSREVIDHNSNNDNILANAESQLQNQSAVSKEEIDSLVKSEIVVKDKPKPVKQRWFFRVNMDQNLDNFHTIVPDMAFTWPFELDVFQKLAIMKLEKHENVFVAAHTSAGKTVVAEYAIALAAKHLTKTVYTSPIKALSNQKFRDFKNTFGDVGLLTGDVQINPEASCLIMTTEILRSMLYNGSDTIRDIEWVIFDEVHYINDDERGVVWEEVLILLPDHVGLILLSATVSNSDELADWVGRTKRKKIHVISTTKRPVPLEHFLYHSPDQKINKDLIKIFDSKEILLNDNLREAFRRPTSTNKTSQTGNKNTTRVKPKTEAQIYQSLIRNLIKRDPPMVPAVVFVFSRKKCDSLASSLSNTNLSTKDEKSKIKRVINKSIAVLSDIDKKLPQVIWLSNMLEQGVAVHHSGILPVLKEIVEMLYQEGLVKCLFATETFAMGVNMPAKCVIFDTIFKHDGNSRRRLNPGEYIQMAGRAGRRGKDKTGTVIILFKDEIKEVDLRNMILGKPQKLESKFRLTYGMALKVLRVEHLQVEDLMWRSFAELHKQIQKSSLEKRMVPLQARLMSTDFDCPNCVVDIDSYCEKLNNYYNNNEKLQKILLNEMQSKIKGRFVVVNNDTHQNALGIVLNMHANSKGQYLCKTFVLIGKTEEKSISLKPKESRPYSTELFIPYGGCHYKIEVITENDIAAISKNSCKVKVDKIMEANSGINFKQNTDNEEDIHAAMLELKKVSENNPKGLQTVLSFSDIKRFEASIADIKSDYNDCIASMKSSKCLSCPHFTEHLVVARDRFVDRKSLEEVKFKLSKENLALQTDYQHRKQLLENLGYIDERDIVQLKGRVACEINNSELLITELVFENILSPREPEEIAALLSCIVFQQKNSSAPNLTDSLTQGMNIIKQKASELDDLEKYYHVQVYGTYTDNINFGLAEVVYEWAKGKPFAEIMTLTDVSEGVIVRCMQRLESTCMEVKSAAKIIGDPVLFDKMIEASRMIKRDICFTASLYIK